jgi:tetratricopeptide (TPR) repeat protein
VVAAVLGLAAVVIAILSSQGGRARSGPRANSDPIARHAEPPPRPEPPPATPPYTLAKAVDRDPAKSKSLYDLAGEADKNRDQKRALELYGEAIRFDRENSAALLKRASILSAYAVAKLSGAIADTTEAIRLDPKSALAYELRSRARSRSRDFRGAIDDATEAIRLDRNRVEAYVVQGASYNGLGEWSHAIVDLDVVIRGRPARERPARARLHADASEANFDLQAQSRQMTHAARN